MKAWRNTLLRFGLVNVPVSLTPAKSDTSAISAHHYDAATRQRAFQAWTTDGENILPETTLFYDDETGNPAVRAADVIVPDFAKEITLQAFCGEGTIDPLFYDSAYCLFPAKGGAEGLGLVADILREDTSMMFAGEAVFTDRPRSVVIRWSDAAGCLILHTLTFVSRVRFADMQSAADGLVIPSDAVREQASLLTAALPDTFTPLDTDAREQAIADALTAALPDVIAPAVATTDADILTALRADMASRAEGKSKTTKTKTTKTKDRARTKA